jgi:lactonase family protein with 7-bladed beta-propeller
VPGVFVSTRSVSFPKQIKFLSKALRLIFRVSIFFMVVPAASAQTSTQQYVYLSSPASSSSLVSGFGKSSQTGALSLVPGSPFSERLEGGLVAIDGLGKFLFVLNPQSDDISMFQIDPASGALSEVPGSPFAVPAAINPNSAPSQPIPTIALLPLRLARTAPSLSFLLPLPPASASPT